jgi:putative transposase
MDFVRAECLGGQWFRLLTLIDNFTRECLAIGVGSKIQGTDVVDVLSRVVETRPIAKVIQVDNGREFTSKALDQWAFQNRVQLHFSRPGKPLDNVLIETFNGKLRVECLNLNWFPSLDHVRKAVEEWRLHYNNERPHSALGYLTPREYAAQFKQFAGQPIGTATKLAGASEL